MLIKTKGIVLRNLKYGESSLILDIYTEDFGLNSYIVSGVRNKNSKSKSGGLQLMSLVEIVAYHKNKKALYRIKEFNFAHIYKRIPFEILRSSVGTFMIEILKNTLKEVYYEQSKLTDHKIDTYRDMILRENNRESFISRSLLKPKDHTNRLKLISAPTQIIWGNEDAWIPVSNAKFFEAEILNIRIDIMNKTGHIPMEERPKESVDLLLDFIVSN